MTILNRDARPCCMRQADVLIPARVWQPTDKSGLWPRGGSFVSHSVDPTEAGLLGGVSIREPQMGVSMPVGWVVRRDEGLCVLPRLDGMAERDGAVVDDRCGSDAVPAIRHLLQR